MERMYNLSIIVPVFNTENYLRRCIDSILNQKYNDWELILVDDGSTDNSGKICDEYAAQDARICVIHKKNGGLVSARKAGIQKARGFYIAYVDSDDFVDNDYYERMMAALCMENGMADVVIGGFLQDNGKVCQKVINTIPSGKYFENQKLQHFYEEMINVGNYYSFGVFPSLCLKVFRKEIIFEHQVDAPESITIGEDAAVSYLALLNAKSIVVDNEITGYHYWVNSNSMTHVFDVEYFKKVSVLYLHLKNGLSQYKNFNFQDQLDNYRLYLIQCGIDNILQDKTMTSKQKRKYLVDATNSNQIFENIGCVDYARFPHTMKKKLLLICNQKWFMLAMYNNYLRIKKIYGEVKAALRKDKGK